MTSERLRELLDYDPETGVFRWKVSRGRAAQPGKVAGCIKPSGYADVRIERRDYRAHRLAWLWMTGEWPEGEIDHINRAKGDNRWCNLREASGSENMRNRNQVGESGYRGVSSSGEGRWSVTYNIGSFSTPLRAAWARELFLHRVGDQFAIRSFPEWWETHAEEDCYDEVRELSVCH